MPVVFYPNEDDIKSSDIKEKIEVLMEAAERYKGIVLDAQKAAAAAPAAAPAEGGAAPARKRITPRDIAHSFNWEEIARLLREIRELPEANPSAKVLKANHLIKLAEIYEVLRAAKMPKLEAVRLALMNEANQLRGSSQT